VATGHEVRAASSAANLTSRSDGLATQRTGAGAGLVGVTVSGGIPWDRSAGSSCQEPLESPFFVSFFFPEPPLELLLSLELLLELEDWPWRL
jgi:hypothetical protein